MKKLFLLVLSIIMLGSALILGATAVASASIGSQAWYLNSTDGAAIGSLQMLKNNDVTSGSADIAASGDIIWVADEAAGGDVTFSAGSWGLFLNTDKNWAPKSTDTPKVTIKVGGYNPVTDSFYYFATSTGMKVWFKSGKIIVDAEQVLAPETVKNGDYLVVQVTNNDVVSHPVYFDDGASILGSPSTDPGYPLPEVAAGILLGGGLIGLVSYVAIRRKKVTQPNN